METIAEKVLEQGSAALTFEADAIQAIFFNTWMRRCSAAYPVDRRQQITRL